MTIRRGWLVAIVVAFIPLGTALTLYLVSVHRQRREILAPPKPEAPPDLEKLRSVFASGNAALQRGDGPEAVRIFSSFHFGGRAVEEYRIYFLSNAHQLAGDPGGAHLILARLWRRKPRFVYWQDAGSTLGASYMSIGDFVRASEIYSDMVQRSESSSISGTARWGQIESHLAAGDIASVLDSARALAIKNPRASHAGDAIAILRTLMSLGPNQAIPLNSAERLQRGVSLLRDGDPQDALTELNALSASGVPSDLQQPLQLNRGLALNQLRRYEESNKLLEPLASGSYRFAIPAMYHASRNYRALAASIVPMVNKTTIVRQRVGTVRVHVKGKKKPILRPRYANVKKVIQLVDPAKKAQKESYERLGAERLKDLLALPLADEVRIEVLNTLIGLAEARNQDDYERELVTKLARLDASQEAGLQHFWDKAWEAYGAGSLNAAIDRFIFVHETYRNPNVKRQARFWYARAIERLGRKEEAEANYRSLAGAPYADLYALFSESRGAQRQEPAANPLQMNLPDWRSIAETNMPAELRLAYELTALSDQRDARLEVQKNLRRANQPYADALLADLYNSSGDALLMMRSLRRAYPQLATVEQDSVPAYFLKMYYPMKYQEAIVKYSRQNGLDPYMVMGLIHQESFFNPKARSPVGATGLMQLMPRTAKELARRLHSSANTEDPEVNVRLGTYQFRLMINLFGGAVPLAVASYNAGQGNVLRWRRAARSRPMDEFLESIPFPETRNYVKRVTMLSASYRRLTR